MQGRNKRKGTKSKEAIQVRPSVSPFNELASEYDAWFEEEGKLPFAIEVQAFRQILPSLPRPWVEIGVGSGRFARSLGIEAGIDPSAGLLNIARRQGVIAFLGRGERVPFKDSSFGAVFLIVTLCFIDSAAGVLEEAHRILTPNGKAVLGLVLRESPWGKFYEQKKRDGHRFYKYATFYQYNEVASLLEQAGFTVTGVVSTLFQKPGRVEHTEQPRSGYDPEAGFTVLLASKKGSS